MSKRNRDQFNKKILSISNISVDVFQHQSFDSHMHLFNVFNYQTNWILNVKI